MLQMPIRESYWYCIDSPLRLQRIKFILTWLIMCGPSTRTYDRVSNLFLRSYFFMSYLKCYLDTNSSSRWRWGISELPGKDLQISGLMLELHRRAAPDISAASPDESKSFERLKCEVWRNLVTGDSRITILLQVLTGKNIPAPISDSWLELPRFRQFTHMCAHRSTKRAFEK